ncbi:ribosome modulation factor [Escherichia coli]|uniref:Ribosome modulation factor n=1 Tax=Escherichia coli TaxID=562 RepID=A0A376UCT7_ECOLX|nr:ribosome modulation factor [Escherichia coli]
MKRQKRDRLERAHQRGYQAGIAGRSKEMCPYQTLNQRSQWLGGWRESHGGQGSNGLILSL